MKNFLFILIFLVLLSFSAASAEEIQIHGFISQGYLNSSSNNYPIKTEPGTFQFGEYGINFSTFRGEKLRLALQLMSRNLGDIGTDGIEMDWGFGDYTVNDNFGVKLGRVKAPISLYNQYWDLDFTRTNVLLPSGMYGEEMRPLFTNFDGISFYGTLFADKPNTFDIEVMYGSTNIPDDYILTNKMKYSLNGTGAFSTTNIDLENNNTTFGRIIWNTALEGLRLGYTWGELDADFDIDLRFMPAGGVPMKFLSDVDGKVDVAFIEYLNDRIKFAAERRIFDYDITWDTTASAMLGKRSVLGEEAWYTQLDYYMDSQWTLGFYYSVYYDNRWDKKGTNPALRPMPVPGFQNFDAWQKDRCLSLRYDIEANWNVKAEVHFIDGTSQCYAWLNPDRTKLDQDWTMYALKTTYSF